MADFDNEGRVARSSCYLKMGQPKDALAEAQEALAKDSKCIKVSCVCVGGGVYLYVCVYLCVYLYVCVYLCVSVFVCMCMCNAWDSF